MKNTLFLKILFVSLFFGTTTLSAQNATNSSEEIKRLIEKKRDYDKVVGFGYKIQIYNGKETTAKRKQAQFKILYPRVYSRLVYNAPEWKVQVGNYKTKLDADRALLIFQEEFSGIIVVPMGK
ncbi:SPOR domain-containing protein [Polaribacter batillariae]|uniref:SPOR domain-containing protein n=1 Tax=Polaribacter batillariae TaxID=2808900 RepID=A0ABX7SXC1_9FLAO|nr:SPOR domain-containing protein [Polaribacter batillariae]QTD38917.1 SPOR domain-containing protein [Polaribacter batillariae]